MSEPVKRYNLRQNIPATATAFLPDVVVSAADYASLEQECERLRADRSACWAEFKAMTRSCLEAEKERGAVLAECERLTNVLDRRSVIQGDYIARCQRLTAERDALAAELGQAHGRADYWKQRAKSAEGHLWSSDAYAGARALQRHTRFEGTPWDELTSQQQAIIASGARAVIAEVNARREMRKPASDALAAHKADNP